MIKQNRVTEIATENGLPIVALVQSVSRLPWEVQHNSLSEGDVSRLASFSRNSFVSSIKAGRYSATSPYAPRRV